MSTPRTLLVMRHAHAESPAPDQPDAERALTEQGRRHAAAQGAAVRDLAPQLVLCSAATRAVETLAELGLEDVTTRIEPSIYDGGVEVILMMLAALPGRVRRVLVIGHLPTVDILVNGLVGAAPGSGHGFHPGTVAKLSLQAGWDELRAGVAELEGFLD